MDLKLVSRDQLIELVSRIRAADANGQSSRHLRDLLRRNVNCPDSSTMCDSDLPNETVADYCLGWERSQRRLSREELIALVRSIKLGPAKTEAETLLRNLAFAYNSLHPAKGDLIYYPQAFFSGRSNPTAEEIVDMALTEAPTATLEPQLSEKTLRETFQAIEDVEFSAAMKQKAPNYKMLIQWVIASRQGLHNLLGGSLEMQRMIFDRVMDLADKEFEGDENPWDVAMAIYIWVLGRKVPKWGIEAAHKVKDSPGCRFAKEIAEVWSQLKLPKEDS